MFLQREKLQKNQREITNQQREISKQLEISK